MVKITDFSWNISEKEYFMDHSIDYSKLSRYKSGGIEAIINPQEISVPAFKKGSLVDAIVTNEKKYNENYIVRDIPKKAYEVCNLIYTTFAKENPTVEEIKSKNYYMSAVSLFPKNYKFETTQEKIFEFLDKYYDLYLETRGKTIISDSEFHEALEASQSINRVLFKLMDNNTYRYNQIKFKGKLSNIDFKIMFDTLLVNYKERRIYPIDIKTMSRSIDTFPANFFMYHYDIQARLYSRLLRQILINSNSELSGFVFHPFTFIVNSGVNNETKVFPYTHSLETGTLNYGIISLDDPVDIAKHMINDLKNYYKVYDTEN